MEKVSMRNMKISVRLYLLTGLYSLVLIICGQMALSGMTKIHNNTALISEKWLPSVVVAEELRGKTAEYRLAESGHMLATTSMGKSNFESTFNGLQSEIDAMLKEYSTYYLTNSTDTTLINQATTLWAKYLSYHNDVIANSSIYQNYAAQEIFSKDAYDVYVQMEANFDALVEFNKQGAEIANEQGGTVYSYSRLGVFVLVVAVTVISPFFSRNVISSITNPIDEIEKAASQIANGDLSAQINYHSRDALGRLSHSMRILSSCIKTMIDDLSFVLGKMADGDFTVESRSQDEYRGDFNQILVSITRISQQLSSTLGSIDESSAKVSAGSQQVAHAASVSADGANKQAAVVEHLSVTLGKITTRIQDNAERTDEAKNKAKDAAAEIEASSQQVEVMTTSMERISDKSNEIAKIIKVIDDIAFQTNILALNAAVEAARAGAAGKGFAVVADEVRMLADKSASSAQDTSKLIDDTLAAVNDGARVAEVTAESIFRVKGTIIEVTEIMEAMAVVSEKQQVSLGEVSEEISVISNVVQQNTGTAEESAAASRELNGESDLLKTYVSQFKLK